MKITVATASAVIAAALITGCSSDAGTTSTTTGNEPSEGVPVDYEGFRAQTTACGAEAPEPVRTMQFNGPGDAGIDGPTIVTLTTSCGPIEITVNPGLAAETVNSFVFLAESGYFDGSASHG